MWLSGPEKTCQDCMMLTLNHSVAREVFSECAIPPHVHSMSMHVTARDQFYHMLVLQVTTAGVRRPR